MLSIIICSVSEERLNAVSKNIADTVGVDYELLAFNNALQKWPIAKVYNSQASLARFPFLLFVHEDVLFYTKDWGKIIEDKLQEENCGVIGFAGSRAKLNTYSGWWTGCDVWDCSNYWFYNQQGERMQALGGFYKAERYKQVVVVDGFAMFVRKQVWKENMFDEKLLTGFHCYDIDFSLAVSRHYDNYVCNSHIELCHMSNGSFGKEWINETIKMHKEKWGRILPVMIKDKASSRALLKRREEFLAFFFLKIVYTHASKNVKRLVRKEFMVRPFSLRHLRNILLLPFLKCEKND